MDYYRLEYSEYQGRFHFSNTDFPANTFEWKTVCNVLSLQQCSEFVEIIIQKYSSTNPSNNRQNSETHPSFESIKQEFLNFLLS